jgi:hypothetical protein
MAGLSWSFSIFRITGVSSRGGHRERKIPLKGPKPPFLVVGLCGTAEPRPAFDKKPIASAAKERMD